MWMQMKNISPLHNLLGIDADETKLKVLKEDEITIKDTALGKARAKQYQQSLSCLAAMTEEEGATCNIPSQVLEGLKATVGQVAEV